MRTKAIPRTSSAAGVFGCNTNKPKGYKMRTYETREEAGLMYQYLMSQTNERPIVRDFEKGYAIQRCISGCYWDFEAGRWDNGCNIGERSEWEKRHNLLDFLDA